MSSLKTPVLSKRVIPLDTTVSSDIVFPPDCASSILFSNCSINWARAFYMRSISSISPYLEKRCWSMVSADTCTNLLAGTPLGTVRMVPPPLWSSFLRIRPRRCIFETVLGFSGSFHIRALVLGRLPCYVGSCYGCAAAQTNSRLCLVLLGCHHHREVSVFASFEVWRDRRRIPTDQSMQIN